MEMLIMTGIVYVFQILLVYLDTREDTIDKIIESKLEFWILLIPTGYYILFLLGILKIIFKIIKQMFSMVRVISKQLIPTTKNKIKQIKEYYKQLK